MQDKNVNVPKMSLHFVESDTQARAELVRIGSSLGHHCEIYSDYSELGVYPPRSGIVIVRDDAASGGIGFALDRLLSLGVCLPVVAMDVDPSPTRVVQAVKAGALDYLVLPLRPDRLAACLERIGREAEQVSEARRRMIYAQQKMTALSHREREVLEALSTGNSNKEIARQLQISPRTVEIHRSNMMGKLGARHSAEAIRLRMEAGLEPVGLRLTPMAKA